MALFGRKTVSVKCAQQLQLLADENVIVEFQQLDPNGRIASSGKTRIRKFDKSAMTIALDVPSKAGRPMLVNVGDSVRVYIIQQNQIFKFESPVVARETIALAAGQPMPMVILEAPENLDNGNRRRHFRVTPLGNAPVNVQWRLAGDRDSKVDRPWNKSRVNDISGRGIAILVEAALGAHIDTGKRLELTINVPSASGNAETIKTNAVVRRVVAPVEEDKPVLLGIEFEVEKRDPDACIEQIVSYVTFCQIEMARIQREREG